MEKGYGSLTNEEFLKLSGHTSNISYVKNIISDLLLIHETPWNQENLKALRRQIQFIEISYPLPEIELSEKEIQYLSMTISREIYQIVRSEIGNYERVTYKTLLKILDNTRSLWVELARVHASAVNSLYRPLILPGTFTRDIAHKLQNDLSAIDSPIALESLLFNAKHIQEIRALLRFKGIDPDLLAE